MAIQHNPKLNIYGQPTRTPAGSDLPAGDLRLQTNCSKFSEMLSSGSEPKFKLKVCICFQIEKHKLVKRERGIETIVRNITESNRNKHHRFLVLCI